MSQKGDCSLRKILNYFKPFDYIFILLAILISFIPNFITQMRYGNVEEMDKIAIVKIAGEVVDEFPLEDNGQSLEKTYYPNQGQYNIIEIQGDQIRIKEDNSPDQIGVNTGWISRPGQTAVCLPHGFLIEVSGQISSEELILPL